MSDVYLPDVDGVLYGGLNLQPCSTSEHATYRAGEAGHVSIFSCYEHPMEPEIDHKVITKALWRDC